MSSNSSPNATPDTSLDSEEVMEMQQALDDLLLVDASPVANTSPQASGGATGNESPPGRVDPPRGLWPGELGTGVTSGRGPDGNRRGNALGEDEGRAMMDLISDPAERARDPDAREAIARFLKHAPEESSPQRESINEWAQVWQGDQVNKEEENTKAGEAIKAVVEEGQSRRGMGRQGLKVLFSQEQGVHAFVVDDRAKKDQPSLLEMVEEGGGSLEYPPESGPPPPPDAGFLAELEGNLTLFKHGVEDAAEGIDGLIGMRKWAIIESSNLQDMYTKITHEGSSEAWNLNELYYTIKTMLYMATLADDKIAELGGVRVEEMEGGGAPAPAPAPASRRASRRRRPRKSSRRKIKISKRKKYTKRRKMSKKRRSSRKKLKSRKRR